ncbi:MAG TPA: phage holin family protein [Candidatus Dormibacteraeota bacterium]|jgi:hypothetical protein|nr:phage holin family protein [Candidatus Dormibacteraeota bacterium]
MTEGRSNNDVKSRVSPGSPAREDVPGATVGLDDMLNGKGRAAEVVTDTLTNLANGVAERTAATLRDEMAARNLPERAKQAGVGLGELGASGVLGLGAVGALAAAGIAGLSKAMPVWAASLVGAAILGGAAAGLAVAGQRHIRANIDSANAPAAA